MTKSLGTYVHTHTVICSLHYLPDVRGNNGVGTCECIEKWSYHMSLVLHIVNNVTV